MGIFSQLGISKKKWNKNNTELSKQITPEIAFEYGSSPTTIATLLGQGKKQAKAREIVYQKWSLMESDAICSNALSLLVTSALGGHETTGDIVFIEKTSIADKDKKLGKLVDEINSDLSELLNKNAFGLAYTGSAFGDAYARVYTDKNGVIDLYTDEMVRPPIVQPYEQGSKTIGFAIYTGTNNFERLNIEQMVRLKMPRTQWIPQIGVVEKSIRLAISEDDLSKVPIMPSMAGGSLLYPAEESYDNLSSALMGIVGQRWMDSIDEQMITLNMQGMSVEQQKAFSTSIATMLKKSKDLSAASVKNGVPILERIRHIIPINGEKQLTQVAGNAGQTGRNATISIEDVMFHAKLLSGAIGVDLAMLGFSEILSGGLGEGGFFRTSAQAAEKARIIRASLSQCINDIIDIHTLNKYGIVFPKKDRPFRVNFYGSISALEAEKEETKQSTMNSGLLLVQAMQAMKEAGADVDMMKQFLSKQMMIDEEEAELYSKIAEKEEEPSEQEEQQQEDE